jgi:holo-[acyl-carrier protein] synthase
MSPNIGIDIEEISRFSSKQYDMNKLFYQKIFTTQEIDYCLKKNNPYPHFTARFCAKEATIKALKNEIINFLDIDIVIKNNIPNLHLPKNLEGSVSISHTETYAIAIVMI